MGKVKHGLSHTPEYRIWKGIKTRCYNENHKDYQWYGALGVEMDASWREDFVAFYEDMGPKPYKGATLDRIDVDGPYGPGNCKWASRREQMLNQKRSRRLEIAGVEQTLAEWCDVTGVPYWTAHSRLRRGWEPRNAVGLGVQDRRTTATPSRPATVRIRKLTIRGRTKTLAEWCRETGTAYGTAYKRMRRGWSPAQCVGLEKDARKKR